jgi:hypothetical protein
MPKNLSARPAETLTESINHRLNLYSVAAWAAGVSLLALASPAEAHVVVNRKSIPIPGNSVIDIDLNHDGSADFEFSFRSYVGGCSHYGKLSMRPLNGGAVVGGDSAAEYAYASALLKGAKIGRSAHFASTVNIERPGVVHIEGQYGWYCSGASGKPRWSGKWGGNPPDRYLGVKFSIHGVTHYGWIRLTVNFQNPLSRSVTITAYAYETVANKMITAGSTTGAVVQAESEPSLITNRPSLGMLALGADGLTLWRRLHSFTLK